MKRWLGERAIVAGERRPFGLTGLPALLLAGLLALGVLGVLRQANPLFHFPSLDNGYYLYIGQQIVAGKTVYLDVWESKPPGVFYINALGLWLAHGSRWGVWLLEFGSLFVSAVLSYQVLRKVYGFFPAVFGTLVWLWGLGGVLQGGNLTEEYALPFNFLAVLCFWRDLRPRERSEGAGRSAAFQWPLFIIGLTFAASFALRANNTGVQMALVLAWLIWAWVQKDWKALLWRLLWSGLGALCGLGLISLYFLAAGTFGEMLNAALFYNFAINRGRLEVLENFRSGVLQIGIPAGFALLGYLLLVVRSIEQRRLDPWAWFLIILWPLEAVLCSLSGRGYAHYFIPWMVALGILAAILAEALFPAVNRYVEGRRLPALAGLLFLGVFLSLNGLSEYGQTFRRLAWEREKGVELDHAVAAYLRQNSQPEDTVLVWGARLAFNVLARRQTPSAYLFYPLLLDVPFSRQMAAQFYDDLTSRPPRLIVDAALDNQDLVPALDPVVRREQFKSGKLWPTLPENIEAVLEFIGENYQLADTVAGTPIYRLKRP